MKMHVRRKPYLFRATAWLLALVSCGDREGDVHHDCGRYGGASGALGVDAASGALAGGTAGSWDREAGAGRDTGGMGGSPDIDGNSGASGYSRAGPADEVDAVQGRVIDLYRKVPLGGRTVMLGDRSTVTAADGSFAITGATDVSDIGVLDADRSNLSIYRGLSVRHNLILAHPVTEATERQPHFGPVEGNLSGGAEYPLTAWNDIVVAYVFSERLRDSLVIGGGSNRSGPKYAMMLGFNGEERLEGVLFALGTFAPDPAQEGMAKYSAARWTAATWLRAVAVPDALSPHIGADPSRTVALFHTSIHSS